MIEERLRAAKAVVVVWSAEAVKSQWVRAEANVAREAGTLVQLRLDGSTPPLPFNEIQCADLAGWAGDLDAAGWRKVVASIADLVGGSAETAASVLNAPLPLPSKPSIAVMPFANLSGDPEQEYFADGMVEEITNALTRVRSLFVIASGSGLSFKDRGVSAQEAARQLGVRYVLEGSVRKGGNRVRIAVKLIDASDGVQIWAHQFEDTLEDVFDLQDRVALAVAGEIEPTVQQAEIRRVSARPTENMGSYDLYLRAVAAISNYSKASVLAALDLARRAVALDAEFAPALALLARLHYGIDTFGWSDDLAANRRQGVEMAQRALNAGRDDAAVLALVALSLSRLAGDPVAAQAMAVRATDLNPGSSQAWTSRGFLHMLNGEADLAVEALETALRLDPMGPNRSRQLGFLGQARFFQRRFAEAVELLREAIQLSELPAFPLVLAAGLGHLGETGPAAEALARYRVLASRPPEEYVKSTYASAASALILEGLALAEG